MEEKNTGRFKLVLIISAIILAAIIVKFPGVTDSLSLGGIRSLVESWGIWGPVGFMALYALTTAIGIPGTIPTVAGGLIFGKWLGTLYNLVGAAIGAALAFLIARVLARDIVREKFAGGRWFEKFNAGMEKDGFNYVLFVRLVPVFPFNGINFGSGLTRISFKDYFLGTAIGILPGTFVFTNAAAEIGESAANGFTLSPGIIFAFVLLGVFALIPIAYRKFKKDKNPEGEA